MLESVCVKKFAGQTLTRITPPEPEYNNGLTYEFNSRGFRDSEWPTSKERLQNAIWCFGDSQTQGVGNFYEDMWPQQLQTATGIRTINVSMQAASNKWIARQIQSVLNSLRPRLVIVQWTFLHRDEKRKRSGEYVQLSDNKNLLDVQDLANHFQSSFIDRPYFLHLWPEWAITPMSDVFKSWDGIKAPSWPDAPINIDELEKLPDPIIRELKQSKTVDGISEYELLHERLVLQKLSNTPAGRTFPINRLDNAHDGAHLGPESMREVVSKIITRI